jgi:hypothetical protein
VGRRFFGGGAPYDRKQFEVITNRLVSVLKAAKDPADLFGRCREFATKLSERVAADTAADPSRAGDHAVAVHLGDAGAPQEQAVGAIRKSRHGVSQTLSTIPMLVEDVLVQFTIQDVTRQRPVDKRGSSPYGCVVSSSGSSSLAALRARQSSVRTSSYPQGGVDRAGREVHVYRPARLSSGRQLPGARDPRRHGAAGDRHRDVGAQKTHRVQVRGGRRVHRVRRNRGD